MSPDEAFINRARDALDEARILMEANHYDGAASRCYYAVFYAASALLGSIGLDFATHRAVIAAFGKEFVHSGKVDAKHHRTLIDTYDLRQRADYTARPPTDPEDLREAYAAATEFVSMAEQQLRRQGPDKK